MYCILIYDYDEYILHRNRIHNHAYLIASLLWYIGQCVVVRKSQINAPHTDVVRRQYGHYTVCWVRYLEIVD